jgi:GT2 family glycosyltransferase
MPAVNLPFTPIRVLEVEMTEPIPDLPPTRTADGVSYGRARILCRLHTWPIGFVEVRLPADGLPARSLTEAIERELASEVRRHLRADGMTVSPSARIDSIPRLDRPPCLEPRRKTLDTAPFVSVVVPTVDRPDALAVCLQDIVGQEYPNLEILVVDNAPEESGAAAVVRSTTARTRAIRYLAESRRGTSRARNHGLRNARGEIVAFVDADVRLDRWWLAAIVTAMRERTEANEHISCVTGLILSDDIETQAQLWMEEWGGYSKGLQRQTFNLREHRCRNPLYPFAAAIFGSGANMAFRTAELLKSGGFDVALGGGTPSQSGEDLACFLDVVSGGGNLVYEPGAIVWHDHPATPDEFIAKLHAYGVGLTSFLARHVVRHPRDGFRMAAAIPAAAGYFFRSDSTHNQKRSPSFPRRLWRTEVAGMLRGPFAYARGRARARAR